MLDPQHVTVEFIIMFDNELLKSMAGFKPFSQIEDAELAIGEYFKNFPKDFVGGPPTLWIKKVYKMKPIKKVSK